MACVRLLCNAFLYFLFVVVVAMSDLLHHVQDIR